MYQAGHCLEHWEHEPRDPVEGEAGAVEDQECGPQSLAQGGAFTGIVFLCR